jgi:hypothetical protein
MRRSGNQKHKKQTHKNHSQHHPWGQIGHIDHVIKPNKDPSTTKIYASYQHEQDSNYYNISTKLLLGV